MVSTVERRELHSLYTACSAVQGSAKKQPAPAIVRLSEVDKRDGGMRVLGYQERCCEGGVRGIRDIRVFKDFKDLLPAEEMTLKSLGSLRTLRSLKTLPPTNNFAAGAGKDKAYRK